jgi:hypothetical protein
MPDHGGGAGDADVDDGAPRYCSRPPFSRLWMPFVFS